MATTSYGEKPVWAPTRPRIRPIRLVVAWVLVTASLLVAAWIVPGAHVKNFGGAFLAAAVIAVLNAILPPLIAALRLPLMLVSGLLLVLVLDALMLLAADWITDGDLSIDSFWSALARRSRRVGGGGRARRDLRDERRRHVHAARDPEDRPTLGRAGRERCAGDRLPRDRRPRAARAAAGDAGRKRAEHGPLAGRRRLRAHRVGDRPLVADRCFAGGNPARVERRHPRLSLGREGDGDDDDLLGAARLRRDRASPRRPRAAARRRCEPRQPAFGRGRPHDPHGQPDGRREEGQPRLPGLPRERLQRDASLRAPLLGGRARALGSEPRKAP